MADRKQFKSISPARAKQYRMWLSRLSPSQRVQAEDMRRSDPNAAFKWVSNIINKGSTRGPTGKTMTRGEQDSQSRASLKERIKRGGVRVNGRTVELRPEGTRSRFGDATNPTGDFATDEGFDVGDGFGDGFGGDGGAASAAAALEQQKKEALAAASARFLEARLGDLASRRSAAADLLNTLAPQAVSEEGAALLGRMFAGINQGGAVQRTDIPIDYAAMGPSDVGALQAEATAAAKQLLGMARGGTVKPRSNRKRNIFRADTGVAIAKDVDTVIKGVLANSGVLTDIAGQFGVAPQALVDSIMSTYGVAPGTVKLGPTIQQQAMDEQRAARLADLAANPRRVLEAGYYQAGLNPTDRAKALQANISGPQLGAFAEGGTVSNSMQRAIEKRAKAHRADVGLTVDDDTFARLRVGRGERGKAAMAKKRAAQAMPRPRMFGRFEGPQPGDVPADLVTKLGYPAKPAPDTSNIDVSPLVNPHTPVSPISAPALPTAGGLPAGGDTGAPVGGVGGTAKDALAALRAGNPKLALQILKNISGLGSNLQAMATGGVTRKRSPFARAAVGKSVEGPAIILVGEGKNDEGVQMGTHEYLLAPPGTVVAPGKKGETPSLESAVKALRGQMRKAHVKEGSSMHEMLDMASGGMITAEKAKQILKDGKVRGKPLTTKQKGFFGARARNELRRAALGDAVGPQPYVPPTGRPLTAVDALHALRAGDPTMANNILRGVAGLPEQQSDISVAATPGIAQMGMGAQPGSELYDPLGGADPEIRRLFGGQLPTLRQYNRMSPTQRSLLEAALSKSRVDIGDFEERLNRDFGGFNAQVGAGETARFGRF